MFLTFLTIVRTTVYLTSVGCFHPEMIRDVDTVIHQFRTNVLIEKLEVDTLLQRTVGRSIENIIDHLIEQSFLIDIAVTHNLLQGL